MTTRARKEDTGQPLSAADPAAAAGAIAGILDAARTDFPDAPGAQSDLVTLPAGLMLDEVAVRTVRVRELTGRDEEKIFRALLSRNQFHLRNTVIECGAVQVGGQDEKDTPALLPRLLIGDLDAVIFGIYRMTYGDEIQIKNWVCPLCTDPEDIGLSVADDIPVRRLADLAETRFEIPLRHGATAAVRLPTGADQAAIGENLDRNLVERNTIMLQRCIEEVTDAGGRSHILAAFPSYAKEMGIKDRHSVLEEIASRQPGPQYNDIKFTHNSCGKEVTLGLDLADLFLG